MMLRLLVGKQVAAKPYRGSRLRGSFFCLYGFLVSTDRWDRGGPLRRKSVKNVKELDSYLRTCCIFAFDIKQTTIVVR